MRLLILTDVDNVVEGVDFIESIKKTENIEVLDAQFVEEKVERYIVSDDRLIFPDGHVKGVK